MQIEQAAEAHNVMNSIHPILGKVFFLAMVTGIGMGYALKNDVILAIGGLSSACNLGYVIWKWRHNYRVSRKYPDKSIK